MEILVSYIEKIGTSPFWAGVATVISLLGVNFQNIISFLRRRSNNTLRNREGSTSAFLDRVGGGATTRHYRFIVYEAADDPIDFSPGILVFLLLPALTMILSALVWMSFIPASWDFLGAVLMIVFGYLGSRLAKAIANRIYITIDAKKKAVFVVDRGWPSWIDEPTVLLFAKQRAAQKWEAQVAIMADEHRNYVIYFGGTHAEREDAWKEAEPFAKELGLLSNAKVLRGSYELRNWKLAYDTMTEKLKNSTGKK